MEKDVTNACFHGAQRKPMATRNPKEFSQDEDRDVRT